MHLDVPTLDQITDLLDHRHAASVSIYLPTGRSTLDVDAIVSGDKDLLEWEGQRPPVMTLAQFEGRGSTT